MPNILPPGTTHVINGTAYVWTGNTWMPNISNTSSTSNVILNTSPDGISITDSILSTQPYEYDFGIPPPLPSSPPGYAQSVNIKAPSMPKVDSKEAFYNQKITSVVGLPRVSGDIGLEIECEGNNLFRSPFQYWSCHEDGSLRGQGSNTPVEYVLKVPLKREDIRSALQYLDVKLKEAGSKVIKSQRTSVHVHVNCQKLTIRELYCYLCLYMIFEELLVEWSGPDRVGNLFCLRAKDSEFYVSMLESVLKNGNFKMWKDEYRYSSCNVSSILKFGSLEFRSMAGTVDVNVIDTWVSILWMLKQAAEEYDNPIQIVEEFINIGPLPFFKKIFKDKIYRDLFEGRQGLSGKLWDGLRLMRDVAYSCEWNPPLPKKKPRTKPRSKKTN